ncbi:MAG: ABC transporter substrate-binding protein [Acidimicrobiales bacterium]
MRAARAKSPRRVLAWVLAGLTLTLGVVGAGDVAATASPPALTFAETPGASPNFISPFAPCAYDTVTNVNQFQYLMYRPLYWFGLGGSPAVVPRLSLATPPILSKSRTTVVLSTKGWRFADGQSVDGQSVVFFLNLWKADPAGLCGTEPGVGAPDQIKSVGARGDRVQINFTTPVNATWALYSVLSLITPLPDAWDRTASGPAACATGPYNAASTQAICRSVAAYLTQQGAQTATFTSAFWQSGVDGPWRLAHLDALGDATFVANPTYSGPQRPRLSVFRELAFPTTARELAAVTAGQVDLAYVDPATLATSAFTPPSGYGVHKGPPWSINYTVINFSAADPNAGVIRQLYVRQALQDALDQNGVIATTLAGLAYPTTSPLPVSAAAAFPGVTRAPVPYDPTAARALLSAHGWSAAGGVLTCQRPGTSPDECGPGIAAGTPLSLTMLASDSSPALARELAAESAQWSAVGIKVTDVYRGYATVVSGCQGDTGYDLCEWGSGWTYQPQLFPSGDQILATGGPANLGGYANAHMDALVHASMYTPTSLGPYAAFAASQVPVLYQPVLANVLVTRSTVTSSIGLAPNPYGSLTPEYYSIP